jgi:hypothetical protein
MMKKESLIGFVLFACFIYGINNVLKMTFNVEEENNPEEELVKDNLDDLNEIDVLMEEIDNVEKFDLCYKDDENKDNENKDEKISILESSMIRTIENDILMVNKMIEKKEYLIQLNNKLIEIKARLTNLKNEIEVSE